MLIWKPWVSRISVTGTVYLNCCSMNCCSKRPKRPQNNTGPCHSSTSELEDKTQVLIDYIIVARYREIKPEQKLKLFLFWLCFIKQENAMQLSGEKRCQEYYLDVHTTNYNLTLLHKTRSAQQQQPNYYGDNQHCSN